ncbi:hypothetical protein K2Z84_21470 [Candidatus Binatia bacterium]|nr:hypothetical protein [Candidatus Binatia bacterium]
MQICAREFAKATPESPFDRARAALGERFVSVATDAMRESLTRELEALLEAHRPGDQPPPLAGELLMATVLADTTKAVIDAAAVPA